MFSQNCYDYIDDIDDTECGLKGTLKTSTQSQLKSFGFYWLLVHSGYKKDFIYTIVIRELKFG